jgi:capsid portal protein
VADGSKGGKFVVDLVGAREPPPVEARALPEKPGDALGWQGTGAVPPPRDFAQLWAWFNASSALPPNVNAYAVNKHGFGWALAPRIDLQAKDADEQLRVALVCEKLARGEVPSVLPEEVAARRALVEVEAPIERAQVETALSALGGELPFMSLCIRTTRRMEVTGNSFWEVLRDQARLPVRTYLLPETTVRLTRRSRERVLVERQVRSSPISFRPEREWVRPRMYVQLEEGLERVWFKEFGDPRVVSSRTGHVYPSDAAMREAEPDSEPATEVLHFTPDLCDSGVSDYGEPRWIGAIASVAGLKWSEDANARLLDDGGYPEGFIAISGETQPAEDLAEKVSNFVRERRGSGEAWRPMVLTARGAAGAVDQGRQGQAKIQWIPLREPTTDGMFQVFEDRAARKVQQQFRLPDIMVGRSEESNKAQAEAARDMAEEQVFAVERAAFDAKVDRLLDAMGVRYWRFSSNGPKTTDPPVVVDMVARLCAAGVLTPHEARELVMTALGVPLDRSFAPWKGVPLEYAKVGYAPPPDPTLVVSEEEVEARKRRPFVPLTAELLAKGLTVDGFREACGFPPLGDAERGGLLLAQVAPEKAAPAAPPGGGGSPFGGGAEKPKAGKLEETVKGILDARRAVLAAQEALEGEMLERARAVEKGAQVVEVDEETWRSFWKS